MSEPLPDHPEVSYNVHQNEQRQCEEESVIHPRRFLVPAEEQAVAKVHQSICGQYYCCDPSENHRDISLGRDTVVVKRDLGIWKRVPDYRLDRYVELRARSALRQVGPEGVNSK